jgi:DNA-binding transcriptional ArsR family regulator
LTCNPKVAYSSGVEAVFSAVADPTRRFLLERLRAGGPASIATLGHGLPISRQAVTKHLDMLRAAGLVRVRREGRERLHELNSAPLREVDDWLRPYAEAWDRRLDALRRHLGEEIDR